MASKYFNDSHEVLCRSQQVQILSSLIKNDQQLPPSIFVYGHPATGKSHTVSAVLDTGHIHHAILSCIECYAPRILFEQILDQLSGNKLSSSSGFSSFAKCDNLNDFVRFLKQAVSSKLKESQQGICIVLDRAEQLRDMDANLLPAFLRLQEFSSLNICTILISNIVWEKFRFGTGFCEPMKIHFPQYTKSEVIEILQGDCPSSYSEDFYANYLNLLINVVYLACRNLRELRYMAGLNFKKYVEPIENGEATETDYTKLWRNIEPHFKKSLHLAYLREVSSSQWERMQQECGEPRSLPSRFHIELPYYTKYLLIAAYLASYNPAKVDRRFFMKNHGKQKKTKAMIKSKDKSSNQLLGPKPFPLDRLLAIFYSIVDEKVAPTANIFSQISSLVTLRLLTLASSGSDLLESPRYKCNVGLEFIKHISRSVEFEVIRYLYDFV